MKAELKELLTRYGALRSMWFDGQWESPWTPAIKEVDLYNYVRSLQPNIIINNRVGKARAGMAGIDEGRNTWAITERRSRRFPLRGSAPAWTGNRA